MGQGLSGIPREATEGELPGMCWGDTGGPACWEGRLPQYASVSPLLVVVLPHGLWQRVAALGSGHGSTIKQALLMKGLAASSLMALKPPTWQISPPANLVLLLHNVSLTGSR